MRLTTAVEKLVVKFIREANMLRLPRKGESYSRTYVPKAPLNSTRRASILMPGRLGAAFLLCALAAWSCIGGGGPPPRRPLTNPFPVVSGAIPVPANGFSVGSEFGSGFRGQELERVAISAAGIGVGFGGRASLTFYGYGAESQGGGEDGAFLRVKTLLANPFGPRSAVGLHVVTAWADLISSTPQDDKLRSYDLAVPVEFLLSPPGNSNEISAFAAPRVVIENYDDRVNPGESMNVVIPGAVGGVHFRYGILHVFGEMSLMYVSENQFMGQTFAGNLAVIPSLGVSLHIGRAYRWGGA